MKTQKSLEEFKKRVRSSLIENNNCSEEEADKIMEVHDEYFPMFLDEEWCPEALSIGIVMNYI